MYSKEEMIKILKEQLSKDYNCSVEDLYKGENIISKNELVEGRRILESEGCMFKMVCLEGKVVVSAGEEIMPWCMEKLKKINGTWVLEYPSLRRIDKELNKFNCEIADVHEYFLPKSGVKETKPLFDVKWYEENELAELKNDGRFDEAFAYDENCPDTLAVAAFDNNKIMGVAGASRDSENLWQIGLNVVPEYKNRGVGSNLAALLKDEVLRRGKIPFSGTAQSHMISKNISLNAGFYPVWAEVYSAEK